jgi:predicted extracellular nuclease
MEQYARISGLKDLDEVAKIKDVERFTYLFDMNTQQLDHMYISPALFKKAKYEHIHINTFVDREAQISDHDPSVALLNVCS